MGRWKNDEDFSIESHLNNPPGLLLNAVKLLQSDHDLGQGKMSQYIQEAARASSERKALKEYQFPGRGERRLDWDSDEHKNKSWQPYAAVAAAAYAKDLLGVIMPKEVTFIPPARDAMKVKRSGFAYNYKVVPISFLIQNIPGKKAQQQAPHYGSTRNELLGKITELEARNKYLEE